MHPLYFFLNGKLSGQGMFLTMSEKNSAVIYPGPGKCTFDPALKGKQGSICTVDSGDLLHLMSLCPVEICRYTFPLLKKQIREFIPGDSKKEPELTTKIQKRVLLRGFEPLSRA